MGRRGVELSGASNTERSARACHRLAVDRAAGSRRSTRSGASDPTGPGEAFATLRAFRPASTRQTVG